MTERLYYADSYLTDFTARITRAEALPDGRTGIRLDCTAFYPTGGGQPCDTGTLEVTNGETLASLPVVECLTVDDGDVLHITNGAPPAIGSEVRARIDRARRLDHLQQHTAQHILSQAFRQLFDAPTRGFRIMDAVAEIDVALDDASSRDRIASQVEQALELANQIVWENRPVRVREVTVEEAAQLNLPKLPARTGRVRLVEIEDFDLNACGGTHARRTGEVGAVGVAWWERAKGMTRVAFVAGRRLTNDYRRANDLARRTALLFGVAPDEAPLAVERLLEENKTLTHRIATLDAQLLRYEAMELLLAAEDRGDGTRLIQRIFSDRTAESLKRLALELITHERTIALLGSSETDAARLVFARSQDASGDMNRLMRLACVLLDGRGGGRPELAQGGGRNVAALAQAMTVAVAALDE